MNTLESIPTPRTDAATWTVWREDQPGTGEKKHVVVDAPVASQLEREISWFQSRIKYLEGKLWECVKLSGADTSNGILTWPEIGVYTVQEVTELRHRYDEACKENPVFDAQAQINHLAACNVAGRLSLIKELVFEERGMAAIDEIDKLRAFIEQRNQPDPPYRPEPPGPNDCPYCGLKGGH